MSTAVWDVNVAAVTVLETDAALRLLLKRSDAIYSGRVPLDAKKPYIVFGSVSETAFGLFAGVGNRGGQFVHLWSEEKGNREVATMYAHVERLLNRVRIPVSKNAVLDGVTNLLDILQDPDGGSHGVVTYETVTLRTA